MCLTSYAFTIRSTKRMLGFRMGKGLLYGIVLDQSAKHGVWQSQAKKESWILRTEC